LDEYLEHFDREEIGEYGDEATVGLWSNILETPRSASTSSNTAEGGDASAEAGTSADAVGNTSA
ncbi:hypothetical protein PHYSODRAFT_463514, partial [Phytophthora sojae]